MMFNRLQPILQRFLSVALILNGTLLLINWVQNENPNKDHMILWIALANLGLGVVAFIVSPRRRQLTQKEDD